MEFISIFDMLKIGVGPSSSHTLGPWRASQKFNEELSNANLLNEVKHLQIELFGSLSLTGKGHATDIAVALGLLGEDPETINTSTIPAIISEVKLTSTLQLNKKQKVRFDFQKDVVFHKTFLPFHSNAVKYTAFFLLVAVLFVRRSKVTPTQIQIKMCLSLFKMLPNYWLIARLKTKKYQK
jgi:L-serine dehydratase